MATNFLLTGGCGCGAVRFEVGRHREVEPFDVRAEDRRPDDFARLPVDDARAEYSGDDDDGALALMLLNAVEDAREVRRPARPARWQKGQEQREQYERRGGAPGENENAE